MDRRWVILSLYNQENTQSLFHIDYLAHIIICSDSKVFIITRFKYAIIKRNNPIKLTSICHLSIEIKYMTCVIIV